MKKSDIMKAAEEAAEWLEEKPEGEMSWYMGSDAWYRKAPSRETMAEMLCKAAELLKQVEWQPIKTAPFGKEVLIYGGKAQSICGGSSEWFDTKEISMARL